MWWSRALLCLMVLALGPAGCGFQPVYARPDGAAVSPIADQLASVRVALIEDRAGQKLRNILVETLSPRGEPTAPRYVLTVKLHNSFEGTASSRDGAATIGRVASNATFTMEDPAARGVVFSGTARAFSGFRFLGPRYASTAAEREAETAVITELASEIRSAIIAYLTDPATFQRRESEAKRQLQLLQTQQLQELERAQQPPFAGEQ